MVAYFFAFMQLILNLFSSAHNLRQSQGFLLEMFLSKEDAWQGAKGITTWTLYLPTHHSFLSPRLALPPSPILQNEFHWKEAENMRGGGSQLFHWPNLPQCVQGYSGFSKTLMDLVLRWLCILAKTWWVNYCFPKKATLSRRAWKNGGGKAICMVKPSLCVMMY